MHLEVFSIYEHLWQRYKCNSKKDNKTGGQNRSILHWDANICMTNNISTGSCKSKIPASCFS